MNLSNALLVSAASPSGVSTAGDLTWSAAVPVGARCVLDDVTRAQLVSLGARIAEATAVMFVLKAGTSFVAEPKQRVIVLPDDGSSATYEIVYVRDREKDGGLSHFECYLRAM